MTIFDMFKAAGYEDFTKMEKNTPYEPKIPLEVRSFNLKTLEPEFRKVNTLYYKGLSKGYLVTIIQKHKSFHCTKDHQFFSKSHGKWMRAEELVPSFTGLNADGQPENIGIDPSLIEFHVLDMEVDENHSYLSAGVLSHNTFGGGAKVFSNGLKYINPILANCNTSMIIINQERASMETHGSPFQTPGGYAPKYYASWRGRITRIDDIKDNGIITGIVSKVRNTKNKIGIPKREAILNLRFKEGFNSEDEYAQFLIDLNIVEQKGAWLYNTEWDMKVCGREKMLEFLKERPEIFTIAKNTINSMMMTETILDADKPEDDDDDEEAPPPIREIPD